MLGISLYNFMSSVNSEFYLLLPKLNFLKTFSYRIDLARTFSAMLNKGGERRHHYLVMIRGKALCFLSLSIILSVDLSYMVFTIIILYLMLTSTKPWSSFYTWPV